MSWFNCTEIRVRGHVAKNRPGSRPVLMVVYSLEGHEDVFDWLSLESDKQFAKDKAGSRWIELCGEEPVPKTVGEALEREGELCVPLRISIVKCGEWERVSEVSFEEAKDEEPDPNLVDDRVFLEETTTPEKPKSTAAPPYEFNFNFRSK